MRSLALLKNSTDILSGEVEWRGLGVINPFGDNGLPVDLADYPKLKNYLEVRKPEIAGRHVAQKSTVYLALRTAIQGGRYPGHGMRAPVSVSDREWKPPMAGR